MEESNPELESFRQQWRAEVSARSQVDRPKTKPSKRPPPIASLSSTNVLKPPRGDEEVEASSFAIDGPSNGNHAEGSKAGRDPQSALEHYEKAVERENEGSLGDSLNLYRKAFRVGGVQYETWSYTDCSRWIIKSIKNTRTNTFPHRTLHRNLRTQTPPTQHPLCPILPTTP